MFKILVIDDDPIVRTILKRTLEKQGYDTIVVSNGEEGILQARQIRPALIICDWMMSPIDGLEVCRTIQSDPDLSSTFFVLLTARGEVEDRVMGLDAGADEFLSKPIDMNELKARVRAGLRLHQLNEDLQQQKQALEVLNKKLRTELDEAAEYVRSLLPPPLKGTITTKALFQPSAELGGDCFDYFYLDDDHLAVYLLDVSGHGVGSALLSVAVLNVMRSRSLPSTNFYQPSAVLSALNTIFEMTTDKYFTIWYGVFNRVNRQLTYSCAGHPPAVLLSGTSETSMQVKELGFPGLPIGILPDGDFEDESYEVEENSSLYIFSDGAYEILDENENIWGLKAFINVLTECRQNNNGNLNNVLAKIKISTAQHSFDDDLSLLEVNLG